LFDEGPRPEAAAAPSSENSFVFHFGEEVEPLHEIEKKYVQFVFERNNRAKEMTAKALRIDRKTLARKLHEIDPAL
jgi:two-component system response regulator HydG